MFCLCEEEFLITPSPVDVLTPVLPLENGDSVLNSVPILRRACV